MGHTIGDANIVITLATTFVVYLYFRQDERRRRLEIEHRERMAARQEGRINLD